MHNIIMSRLADNKFVLIAEIGVNYYDIAKKLKISNIDAAKFMIKKAKDAGIHAVKFQTYKAGTLTVKNSPSYWDTSEEPTTSQYELFKKFDSFGYDEYKQLSDYCNEINIEFLSTAFDIESADYLFELMNVYKISSSDLNNLPFIEYQAKKNKPIILSVGASTLEEIEKSVVTIKKYNDKKITLMHCVLEYPTIYEHANLNKIISLKKHFPETVTGYSDHTKPDVKLDIIKTAYNLGAVVIEKHFTLDKTIVGNDHYHAMDFNDAENIIKSIESIDKIRGSYEINYTAAEEISRKNARRSLVITVGVKAGEKITKEMITFKRPGTGIPPSEIHTVIGKKAAKDIAADSILFKDMIK